MDELAGRVFELRRATENGTTVTALRSRAQEWQALQAHDGYAKAPQELQALILAESARTLRTLALACNDFTIIDEAISLLRKAQTLSRHGDAEDHIEYRLDELRFRNERFRLSHDRHDVWEAYMCGVRFDHVTGGNIHSIGNWSHPGPLQWGETAEECNFDGAECHYLVGKAFRGSYDVFGEGEALDLAIGFFEVSIPNARFDWQPLRQYAADLAAALVERFRRCHQQADAFAALHIARRATTEIAVGDEPLEAAVAALAQALLASHAAGAPSGMLREAISSANRLTDPRMAQLRATARFIFAAEHHDLSWWLSSPPAEIVLAAGEHLLWRFRATNELSTLESAIQTLRLAVSRTKVDAERSIANCRLAEALTHRAISVADARSADSAKAAASARTGQNPGP